MQPFSNYTFVLINLLLNTPPCVCMCVSSYLDSLFGILMHPSFKGYFQAHP
eukprot:c43028_g1_i1 orf=56-208(+)